MCKSSYAITIVVARVPDPYINIPFDFSLVDDLRCSGRPGVAWLGRINDTSDLFVLYLALTWWCRHLGPRHAQGSQCLHIPHRFHSNEIPRCARSRILWYRTLTTRWPAYRPWLDRNASPRLRRRLTHGLKGYSRPSQRACSAVYGYPI